MWARHSRDLDWLRMGGTSLSEAKGVVSGGSHAVGSSGRATQSGSPASGTSQCSQPVVLRAKLLRKLACHVPSVRWPSTVNTTPSR